MSDRRRRKSVAAITRAFETLLDERGLDGFGIGDIVDRADIARSTFYRYYSNKEDVLCAMLEPILLDVAACVASRDTPPGLAAGMEQLWLKRTTARSFFTAPALTAQRRMLARLIQQQRGTHPPGPIPERLLATALATAALGLVEEWLSGRDKCSPTTIAGALHTLLYGAARAVAGKQQL
ncbi:MAG: TetR/AcrR family transcriptional regulator [Hyphomonadaceae bacterium]